MVGDCNAIPSSARSDQSEVVVPRNAPFHLPPFTKVGELEEPPMAVKEEHHSSDDDDQGEWKRLITKKNVKADEKAG